MPDHRPAPILVTGMPRSGTTWLARVLATGSRLALVGREPMNPRHGQYALGGTLSGWTRLERPSRRQTAVLRRSYQGRNPLTYGRYGRRQLTAARRSTRVVVKDPFALISAPTVQRITGARVVVLYRHPAANLVSYRRMGWTADLDELARAAADHPTLRDVLGDRALPAGSLTDVDALGHFWSTLYGVVLEDLAQLDSPVVVSHEELAAAGLNGTLALFEHLHVTPTPETTEAFADAPHHAEIDPTKLHNFDRSPEEVASSWRGGVTPDELRRLEDLCGPTLARLQQLRFRPGT